MPLPESKSASGNVSFLVTISVTLGPCTETLKFLLTSLQWELLLSPPPLQLNTYFISFFVLSNFSKYIYIITNLIPSKLNCLNLRFRSLCHICSYIWFQSSHCFSTLIFKTSFCTSWILHYLSILCMFFYC